MKPSTAYFTLSSQLVNNHNFQLETTEKDRIIAKNLLDNKVFLKNFPNLQEELEFLSQKKTASNPRVGYKYELEILNEFDQHFVENFIVKNILKVGSQSVKEFEIYKNFDENYFKFPAIRAGENSVGTTVHKSKNDWKVISKLTLNEIPALAFVNSESTKTQTSKNAPTTPKKRRKRGARLTQPKKRKVANTPKKAPATNPSKKIQPAKSKVPLSQKKKLTQIINQKITLQHFEYTEVCLTKFKNFHISCKKIKDCKFSVFC